MVEKKLISEVCEFAEARGAFGQPCQTGVDGLLVFCDSAPTTCAATLYEPIMCLVLQGRKEAQLGRRRIEYGAGESVIVSHAVPVVAGVTEATRELPYAALVLRLDLALVRSLYDEIGETELAGDDLRSIDVAETDVALVDAMARLFRISHDPVEIQALAPLVLREIHFRLLRARHGGMLRQLLWRDSPASRISKAIARIRSDFTTHILVAELAETAGMSQSAFHEHFKTVTSTTPLQYQKDLRLMEARRLLTAGTKSVSLAAFEVGYESPTQFSREYARKFGVSPRDDKTVPVPAGFPA